MSKSRQKKVEFEAIPGITVCSKCGQKQDRLPILPYLLYNNELRRVKLLDKHPPGSFLIGDKCAAKMLKYRWGNDAAGDSAVS